MFNKIIWKINLWVLCIVRILMGFSFYVGILLDICFLRVLFNLNGRSRRWNGVFYGVWELIEYVCSG